jgi:glycosyltransferase involved in cell wall biosynthesis
MAKITSNLSIFFPAFNDAPSLPGLIGKAFSVAPALASQFEVIVVNDGSSDSTGEALVRLQQQFGERLRVVTHPTNRGYGGALRSGIEAARYDLIFYTDGDGQYEVGELPLLFAKLRPEVGLVNGYKLQRHDPAHRIAIGWLYNRFARALFKVRLRDIDCDFRLFRRELITGEGLVSTTGTVCVELVKKIEASGCEVEEVGVSHYARLHGRSQFFRLRSLANTFRQICWLYMRYAASGRMPRALDRKADPGMGT